MELEDLWVGFRFEEGLNVDPTAMIERLREKSGRLQAGNKRTSDLTL